MIGKPVQYADDKSRPYKVFGVPRKMLLEHRLMSKPGSVVRDITVNVARALDEAAGMSSEGTRVVLTGRPGCGKSVTLLQSVEYCKSQDWIVLYIPRGIELVNSSSNHVYDLRTRTYLQPYASKQLLMRLITANASALAELKTTEKHDLTPLSGGAGGAAKEVAVIEAGEPLVKLAEVGTRDFMRYGAVVLEKVMWELSQQEQFPVLLAVDEFQAIYCKTQYRDPNFAGISSYHLSVPRMLMEFASAKRTFKRGAILTAISSSPQYITPLELEDALALSNRLPPSPYYKRSATLTSYTEGLVNLPVPERLSVEEAAGVYGVWNKDKAILPDSLHDENFLAKYSEASGNARDFVWKGFLSSLQS
ncbi:mitochondrial ribosomal death-associated protein 3-domain-containing protein [Pterulicium gracile]|uniref:Small ribosomal subunit protein mS29 n=1 Tax=Pterulicium gracile TaxID=1884261 RepID=A0A5C3QFZ9_9AGAR|nr:mitochondrial ribosomal death-associated protein 3-domain-containing protein [Pterula gracilis]